MRTYLGLLTNAVRSALRSKHDLMLENLALRQQLALLTRQRARTRTKPADRLFWSWLSRYWPGSRSTLVMVQPETVIRWHRTAWRGYWTWKSRARHPGRPRISKERQGLIARLATENPRWGAVRVQGELLALGYEVSAETVRCYRRRARAAAWRRRPSSPVLVAPAVVGLLRDLDLLRRLGDPLPFAEQPLHLPQLPHDLLRRGACVVSP